MNSSVSFIVPLSALALSLCIPISGHAEPSVILWGFRSGCDPLPDEDRAVEKQLHKQRADVALLRAASGKGLPSCVGEKCAQALRSSCPNVTGRILGGQVVSSRNIVKTRLWLHDLATGQTAYQDDYCQSCDLGAATALSVHARRLIDQPRFGSAAGSTPTYCTSATQPEMSGGQAPRPIFLTVYGDGKHKAPLLEALKQQMSLRGRQVLPVTVESKTYSSDDLKKIVAGQRDAQVLGINVHKDGKLQVFLYDQPNDKIDWKTIECSECAQDKEALVAKVPQEVAGMLERCFGWSCADPSGRPAGTQPPVEACEPFPTIACAVPELDALLAAPGTAPTVSSLAPKTARLIKGLAWGGFAAGAVATIGLFAANAAGAGTISGSQEQTKNGLVRPAWAATGFTALALGIAIPITLIVERAQAKGSNSAALSSGRAVIQCPN